MVDDLDILFPEKSDAIKLTGRVDGIEYIIDMFIPSAISLISGKKKNENDMEYQLRILECFLSSQHKNMDVDWIKNNISLPKMNYIYYRIIEEINKGTEAYSKRLEAVRPVKEPTEKKRLFR